MGITQLVVLSLRCATLTKTNINLNYIKMKKSLLLLLLALITINAFSQKNYNRFEDRHPLIDFVEFKTDGMELKLSKAGIKYVQKDLKYNSQTIAKLVLKLHNEMVGGSSQLNEDCIASQVFYHVIFYDTNKSAKSKEPNRKLLRKIEKYVPIAKLKRVTRIFSNYSANPINTNYVELNLRGCRQLNMFVVPPNIFK
jgi:hypothetical protein